ncbi:MAG: fasciclin domain-containing protein [Ilumatobacteraceae bacterium]
MINRRHRTRNAAFAALAALTFVSAACGSDDDDAAANAPAATEAPAADEAMTTEPMTTEMTDETMMSDDTMASDGTMAAGEMLEPSGPACASLPTSGEGSLEGMADDPAATAASNNPELSTLVAAVTAAGLVDTLNGPGPFTIFAPANSAFAKIDTATLDSLLADPTGDLTDILTLHVVSGSMSSTDLVEAGTVPSLAGEVTIAMDGDTVTVDAGGGPATVVCADVPVANGTVHIIDTVLMAAP